MTFHRARQHAIAYVVAAGDKPERAQRVARAGEVLAKFKMHQIKREKARR